MKSIRRFTLIELLAVMALIAILGTIGFGAYSYSKNKAKESATEALLKQLEAGLEGFHTKSGYYPPSGGNFSPITFTFDTGDGTVSEVNFGDSDNKLVCIASPSDKKDRMKRERFDAFVKSLDMQAIKGNIDSSGVLLDAWGNRIYYRAPGVFKSGGFDLVSAGPDGKFGKGKADSPSTTDTDYRESGEKACDDIFNF